MGNCGFGVAPSRPEHRDTIVRTLENVEGMAFDALVAGIDWSFETFPEYLDTVDRLPKRLNAGGLFIQWLQAYEVDGQTVRTVYATLGSVFPFIETWRTQSGDMLLMASAGPPSRRAIQTPSEASQE